MCNMQDSVAYKLPWLCTYALSVSGVPKLTGTQSGDDLWVGRAWKGGSSMPRQRQRRTLSTAIPNTGFISQSREVLDKHGKFTAHQDWPAITPMLVRWHLVLLPFVRPAAADWLSNSASLKLRLKDALMARRCTLTYLGKHCEASWDEARGRASGNIPSLRLKLL